MLRACALEYVGI